MFLLDLYHSFEEFYESFFRGNEIEFTYKDDRFFILPIYNQREEVIGVRLGAAYREYEVNCFSKNDLLNALINKV